MGAEIAKALVHRIERGDPEAETELVERYSPGLLDMLRRMTGDPALADDLHQATFFIVLERLRECGLDEPARLAGYLRGTARNLFIEEYRKKLRRQTENDVDEIEKAADPAPNPLRQVLRKEETGRVRRLIGELKCERDRQLLYRFYIAEEDKKRLCADLGLSSEHFDRVLFRARQRFSDLWEK